MHLALPGWNTWIGNSAILPDAESLSVSLTVPLHLIFA